MSSTLVGWILIAISIPIFLISIAPVAIWSLRNGRFNVDVWLHPSMSSTARALRGTAQPLILAFAAFVVVAGVGVISSHMRVVDWGGDAETDEQVLARLADYARSIGPAKGAPPKAEGQLLPDVEVMIQRLATRLEREPNDVQGWRMLGWSYFNTGHFQQAAAAYAKAIELDPTSPDIKLAYETASQRASEEVGQAQFASSRDEPTALATEGSGKSVAHETNASVRSMVDRLAHRLENSPKDLDGWVQLMRSRVILGEEEVATRAFRRALDVFKDDSTASATIAASATELGLPINN